MKNGPFLFLGLFVAFVLSWGGLAFWPSLQLRELSPYFDVAADKSFPESPTGLASRGQQVYRELGCVACHTQQVRGIGSDVARHWGTRQSWARDYLFRDQVPLGAQRTGPDLANVGTRRQAADELYRLLYAGTDAMPAYAFLFDERPADAQPSGRAVARNGDRELVPSHRAEALVAYLMSLKSPEGYAPETANNQVKQAQAHPPAKAGEAKAEAAGATEGAKK